MKWVPLVHLVDKLAHVKVIFLILFTGHTIVFTDQSGMNASGHVMLGSMDVHQQWIKVTWHKE